MRYQWRMDASKTGSQAIDRAAQILVRLVESDEAVTLAGVMEDTRLPKSTAARLLRALERNGLAQRRRGGGFRPGPVLVEYARRDYERRRPRHAGAGRSSSGSARRQARRRTWPSRRPAASRASPRSTATIRSARATGSAAESRSTRRRWARCSWRSEPRSRRSAVSRSSARTRSRPGRSAGRARTGAARRLRDDVGGARRGPLLDGRARPRLAGHGHRGDLGLGARRFARRASVSSSSPARSSWRRTRCPTCTVNHDRRRTRSMTNEEILQQIYDDTLVGNKPAVVELTEQRHRSGDRARTRCCSRR